MGHSNRGPARLLGTALLPLTAVLDSESFVSTVEDSLSNGWQLGINCTTTSPAGTAASDTAVITTFPPSRPTSIETAREFSLPVWHGGVQCGQLHGLATACPAMDSVSVPLETLWEGVTRQGLVPDSPGSGSSGRGSCESGSIEDIGRTKTFQR